MKGTLKYKTRISELETELAQEFLNQDEFEKALADAYAEGTGVDAALKKLTDNREKTAAMVKALIQLDDKLFTVQADEHDRLSAELDKKSKIDFEKTMRSAAKALGPLRKSLSDHLSEADLSRVEEAILETLKSAVWERIDEKMQDTYLEIVPRQPQKAPPRNERGIPESAGIAPKIFVKE